MGATRMGISTVRPFWLLAPACASVVVLSLRSSSFFSMKHLPAQEDPRRQFRGTNFEAQIPKHMGAPIVLREQFVIQHRRLLAIVRDDEVCRRLMTVPGVGPVVALTYRATVDVPARFRKFKEMVLAQGLGDADRQAPRNEKGDRGAGASVGRDHAPHMG